MNTNRGILHNAKVVRVRDTVLSCAGYKVSQTALLLFETLRVFGYGYGY